MTADREKAFRVYQGLVASHTQGLARIYRARIVSNTTQLVLAQLNTRIHEVQRDEAMYSALKTISPQQYDSFRYVTNVTYLVYLITLFDSFLTETTRFLFLLFPGALGKTQTVSLDIVLKTASRADLIKDAVNKKVREMAYSSFLDRVEALRQRFGLEVKLDATQRTTFEHYSSVRNVVVHDQSAFEATLDAQEHLDLKKKGCFHHPSPVREADFEPACVAVAGMLRGIYSAVAEQILGAAERDEYQKVVAAMDNSITRLNSVAHIGETPPETDGG